MSASSEGAARNLLGLRRTDISCALDSGAMSERASSPPMACPYLEAGSPANRPPCERLGFEFVGELRAADRPPLWPMWREPR